jgi:transcriptional regulator with XRE-family HTH domain
MTGGAAGRQYERMGTGVGSLIRESRLLRGWSQSDLARELCKAAGRAAITREDVSRWERGKRRPGPYWTRSITTLLLVPAEEFAKVKRRDLLRLSGAAIGGVVTGSAANNEPQEIFASIAAGDNNVLGLTQTSRDTDLAIADLSIRDKGAILHLAYWLNEGASDIVRVNAAGILAKTRRSTTERR